MAYITLNKKYFFNNLDIIAQRSKGKDKIALVLKDNAYGHGLLEIATMAKEYGITKAVVRSYDEAKRVEDFFDYILVLADFPEHHSEKIHYTINDLSAIEKFPSSTKVELKINTGMNRNGIEPYELREAFNKIKNKKLILEAIFTHHSCADEESVVFDAQNREFRSIKAEVEALQKEFGVQSIDFHSCNSAALFKTEDFDEKIARIGIAAYGCLELAGSDEVTKLKPILSVYAQKISTRRAAKGATVGYNATYEIQKEALIGNYDFGYGDGFLRICSNNYTTPDGIDLLGRISMDNSSFMSGCDEILIFNDAREMAKFAKTISYEVLTSLKPHIKRIVL
jgi:alanine racemase